MKRDEKHSGAMFAEFFWQEKLKQARTEGERLRQELRRRGIDPALILEATRIGQRTRRAVALLMLCASVAMAGTNEVVHISVPSGTHVIVSTNADRPNPSVILPMAHQLRMARQMAAGMSAPWNQRFIVTKVEEFALTRMQEDEQGLPTGVSVFSTNYAVTIAPVATNETNAPVVWGVTKTKQIRFFTTRPAKKGDEYDFFPIQ